MTEIYSLSTGVPIYQRVIEVFGATDPDVCCEAGEEEGDPLRGACSSTIVQVCHKHVYSVSIQRKCLKVPNAILHVSNSV